jgi:hypothetical protein
VFVNSSSVDAATSTLTPISTGLFKVFKPRVLAVEANHSAPTLPGATITYFDSIRSFLVVKTPEAFPFLMIRSLICVLNLISTFFLNLFLF